MNKEELRKLIHETNDVTVLNALWELYELKFCKTTAPTSVGTLTSVGTNGNVVLKKQNPLQYDNFIYCIDNEAHL